MSSQIDRQALDQFLDLVCGPQNRSSYLFARDIVKSALDNPHDYLLNFLPEVGEPWPEMYVYAITDVLHHEDVALLFDQNNFDEIRVQLPRVLAKRGLDLDFQAQTYPPLDLESTLWHIDSALEQKGHRLVIIETAEDESCALVIPKALVSQVFKTAQRIPLQVSIFG